jgi:hypothetical protein
MGTKGCHELPSFARQQSMGIITNPWAPQGALEIHALLSQGALEMSLCYHRVLWKCRFFITGCSGNIALLSQLALEMLLCYHS